MRFCRSVVEARISFSICLASSVVKVVDMVAEWGGWWCKVGRVDGMITSARKLGSDTKLLSAVGERVPMVLSAVGEQVSMVLSTVGEQVPMVL
jgi:hypothetical protein